MQAEERVVTTIKVEESFVHTTQQIPKLTSNDNWWKGTMHTSKGNVLFSAEEHMEHIHTHPKTWLFPIFHMTDRRREIEMERERERVKEMDRSVSSLIKKSATLM